MSQHFTHLKALDASPHPQGIFFSEKSHNCAVLVASSACEGAASAKSKTNQNQKMCEQ
jgi:hypothetical protein